jgi:hypothetical protein
MKLTPNKRRFYQQGIRAATLIESNFRPLCHPPQVHNLCTAAIADLITRFTHCASISSDSYNFVFCFFVWHSYFLFLFRFV